MNRTQEIIFGETGQTLTYTPSAYPSSPTVAVYEADGGDDSTAEVATTGAASVDSVSTTVDVASGYGQTDPRIIYVAATTNVAVGERYIITGADGETEIVEVVEFDSGNSVTARHALHNAYAVADTFKGLKISIAVLAAWAADSANLSPEMSVNPRYRLRWEFTGGGKTCVRATYLDLVRYAAVHDVTGVDVDAMFPGFLESLPTSYREEQGRPLIDAAYRAVQIDLMSDGKRAHAARHAEVLDMLTVHRANVISQELRLQRGGGSLDAVEVARAGYRAAYDSLIRQAVVAFATDSSGAGTLASREPVWRR